MQIFSKPINIGHTWIILTDETPEGDFQELLVWWAKDHGWKVHAERPARTKGGWATPIQGDVGFPDLVLARTQPGCHGELVVAELKSEKGVIFRAQAAWLQVLADSWGADVYVWRPSQWEEIQRILE